MGLRSVPKLVTLSDLERPCGRHYTLLHTIEANCIKFTDNNVA